VIESSFDELFSIHCLNPARNVEITLLTIERSRFQTWAYIVGFSEMYGTRRQLHRLLSGLTGHKTCDILERLRRILSSEDAQLKTVETNEFRIFVETIRNLLNDLERLLPETDRKSMNQALSTKILEPEDVCTLESLISSSFVQEHPSLEASAAMKRIRILSERSESTRQGREKLTVPMENLQLESEQYRRSRISTGLYCAGEASSETPVPILIEWKKYEGLWDTDIGNLLFRRTEMLTSFLRTASNGSELLELRILKCLGYCHDERNTRLGFIFVIPASAENTTSYLSLNMCLASQKEPPPLLGDRFRLARTLSTAMFEFHKTFWVHKSFSSHTILFFPEPKSVDDETTETAVLSNQISILAPYIVGFNYSRPDQPNQFSEPAALPLELQRYRHPEYKNRPMQYFHRAFDYYSLGIVLLEIGLWYPLSAMLKRHKELSASEFTAELLKSYCPTLGSCMGSIYRDVVVNLLSQDWGRGDEMLESAAGARAAALMAFQTRVLAQLDECQA
jgi:hypothetical protein